MPLHRRIKREAAVVVPDAHRADIIGIEPAPPDEPAQHAMAEAGLNGSDIGLTQRGQLADAQRPVIEEK